MPYQKQMEVTGFAGLTKPTWKQIKLCWDNIIPNYLKSHLLLLRQGTIGKKTLDGQDASDAVKWFKRHWNGEWKQWVEEQPLLKYFERDMLQGWHDSVKAYCLREVLSVFRVYGKQQFRMVDTRKDLRYVPKVVFVETDQEGGSDSELSVLDEADNYPKLLKSTQGLETLRSVGTPFPQLLRSIAVNVIANRTFISPWGWNPPSETPEYIGVLYRKSRKESVKLALSSYLAQLHEYYMQQRLVNPELRVEDLADFYREGLPIPWVDQDVESDLQSESSEHSLGLFQNVSSPRQNEVLAIGDQLLVQNVHRLQDLEEQKNEVIQQLSPVSSWNDLHPIRHQDSDEESDGYHPGSSVNRSHSSQKDDSAPRE